MKNAVGSIGNPDSEIDVRLTSSQQMFEDLTPALKRKLPVYAGDLLLIEHSAGSTTSQVFMKRMNRKNELLAKAAEQVAAGADAAGIARYPFEKINPAWELILGSQMHDILPGTAIPQAYEYSWNDEFVAANLLASTLENAVSRMAARMDTRTAGHPLVVYNPVAAERDDIAEATLALPADTRSVIVRDADGNILPSQYRIARGQSDRVRLRLPHEADEHGGIRCGAFCRTRTDTGGVEGRRTHARKRLLPRGDRP